MTQTDRPKINVIISIKSYTGKDTWLEVGGTRLKKPDTMYAIVSVYHDTATVDFGYSTKPEATRTAKGLYPDVPVIYGE